MPFSLHRKNDEVNQEREREEKKQCAVCTQIACVCLDFQGLSNGEQSRSLFTFIFCRVFFTGIIKISTAIQQNHYDIPTIPCENNDDESSAVKTVMTISIVEVCFVVSKDLLLIVFVF